MRVAISASRSLSCELVEHRERLRDRQVDVVGDRLALDLDRLALGPQPVALARRALAQRAVRLELLLHGPRALRRSAGAGSGSRPRSRGRTDRLRLLAFRRLRGASPVRRRRASHRRRVAAAPPARTGSGRGASSAACRTAPPDRCRGTPRSLRPLRAPSACRPCPTARSRRRAATWSRPARRARIEVLGRAEALTLGAGAVRRVERERARRHLRHAQTADHAGQLAREQPVAAIERVDDDDVAGEARARLRPIRPAGARCRCARSADRRRSRWCGCGADRA